MAGRALGEKALAAPATALVSVLGDCSPSTTGLRDYSGDRVAHGPDVFSCPRFVALHRSLSARPNLEGTCFHGFSKEPSLSTTGAGKGIQAKPQCGLKLAVYLNKTKY